MNPNFLLRSSLAQHLYHDCAKALPIVDFHNHLTPSDITSNRRYDNITRLWVSADPYKHRAMRILGLPERVITGSASDYEKFEVWYESLPRLIGNPLFDWSVMELSTVFDLELLPFKPCREVWDTLNSKLLTMTAQDILKKFNIAYSAPCTGLTDNLSAFDKDIGLCPSLRGDDLLLPSADVLQKLETDTGIPICNLSRYLEAVNIRLYAFRDAGCRFADHALDNGFSFLPDDGKNDMRFARHIAGELLSEEDSLHLRSAILTGLLSRYAKAGFTVQLHIGAQRTTSTRLRTLAGAAGGYAAMGSTVNVSALVRLLDAAEQTPEGLPNILLFTLNPADNAVMATLCGSYSADGRQALVSQGPAWWWCDHYHGITSMLDDFCCHSVLSTFIGMTTDSRSLLSFVRHDYFRRILCQWLADMVDAHRLPHDLALLQDTVMRICYQNAKDRL